MKEFELIEQYFKPLCNFPGSRDLNDDTASIKLKANQELIISKDIIVENIHFKLSNQAYNIAYKLLQSNLSDIASSGSKPYGYVLGFSKNSKINNKFVKEFCRGLKDAQDQYGIKLLGGDTVNSDQLFFSITIFGIAKKDQILTRDKAQDKDLIFTSGTIGDAGIGLKLLELNHHKYHDLINRHLKPEARINLGLALVKQKISHCAIDISDGLLADLSKIAKASNLQAIVYLNNIAVSKSAQLFLRQNKNYHPINLLNSGEDYELIFTSPKKNLKKILDLAKKLKLNINCIGELKSNFRSNKNFIKINQQLSINNSYYKDELTNLDKKYSSLFITNNLNFSKNINLSKIKLGYQHD